MKRVALSLFLLSALSVAAAQEVLVPLECPPAEPHRGAVKQQVGAMKLPFFDDFSDYQGYPKATHWVEDHAFVGTDYGAKPPTLGMLTLDAIDGQGRLHAGAGTDIFGGDTVTSVAIRLDSVWGDSPHAMSAADSLVLSFYYLPGGGSGEQWERITGRPAETDSLFLDFYQPRSERWVTVWSRAGLAADTIGSGSVQVWQYVAISITDSIYLDSAFRFRFRNYCSLPASTKPGRVGNCDHWNIDYVLLDRGRTVASPAFNDVAFVDAAPSMLRHYRAMPARQFRPTEMAPSLQMTITNLYGSTVTTHYSYTVADESGAVVESYDGGNYNAPSFPATGSYQQWAPHATPSVNFSFATGQEPHTYTITHVVREGSGDPHPQNDTVRYRQVFDNYYAYDDGTPENGYGLSTIGKVAYRFDLNEADTLTAVDLYFNRTRNGENERVPFHLAVWSCEGGRPARLLYRDTKRRYPQFGGLNRYERYVLESAVVVSDTIFVGFEQLNSNYINLGFDRSYNTCDRIFCLYGTEWNGSFLSGSLMLRPCFGQSATVAANRPAATQYKAYPTLTNSELQLEGPLQGCTARVVDMYGRVQYAGAAKPTLGVAGLPCGVYVLSLFDAEKRNVYTTKFIISR